MLRRANALGMPAPQNPYDAVQARLAGTPFGRIRYLEETGSTNEDAAALLGRPDSAGLTIVAGHQTRGAGRKGRDWVAPPGSSLLFSTILPDPIPPSEIWAIPFWTALAVRAASGSISNAGPRPTRRSRRRRRSATISAPSRQPTCC
jgi:hypothetical protein